MIFKKERIPHTKVLDDVVRDIGGESVKRATNKQVVCKKFGRLDIKRHVITQPTAAPLSMSVSTSCYYVGPEHQYWCGV